MKKEELFRWVKNTYGIEPDYPFSEDDSAVLRHEDNRKWFGLVMHITGDKLGLKSRAAVDVLNVKCDPIMIYVLCQQNGFYPAYHMNKQHWVSVLLDGSVKAEEIKPVLDRSYELTKCKKGKNTGGL